MKKRKVEMTLTPESSNIAAMGYDDPTRRLFIRFKSEELYCYEEVPAKIFEEFCNTFSKGAFLANSVKPYFSVSFVQNQPGLLSGLELVYTGGIQRSRKESPRLSLPTVNDQRWAW